MRPAIAIDSVRLDLSLLLKAKRRQGPLGQPAVRLTQFPGVYAAKPDLEKHKATRLIAARSRGVTVADRNHEPQQWGREIIYPWCCNRGMH